jgi:phage terminase large subunit
MNLNIKTPKWAKPLLKPARYKGAKGGRGGGKSHFLAELLVETLVINPNTSAVCIREIQRSLKFSAKKVIEEKINSLGVEEYFEITNTEIRSTKGKGIIIFQGMQDHTSDSIKSLEGFNIAWVEEAHSLSTKSLKLLRPTIRAEGSELWFSWNPNQPTDPVDEFFNTNPKNSVCVNVNLEDNPFAPNTLIDEAKEDRLRMLPEDYAHVWQGNYNTKSDALVFKNKYEVQEFEPGNDWSPLYGIDFGFSQDPTTANEVFVTDDYLYIYREANKVGLELDDTAPYIIKRIPEIKNHISRADNARPESISYLKRKGLPLIKGEPKLKIEDGVSFMKSFKKIIIHPRCKETIKEFSLYSYKVDKRTSDVLPVIEDKYNHHIDDIRYALYPLIKKKPKSFIY